MSRMCNRPGNPMDCESCHLPGVLYRTAGGQFLCAHCWTGSTTCPLCDGSGRFPVGESIESREGRLERLGKEWGE